MAWVGSDPSSDPRITRFRIPRLYGIVDATYACNLTVDEVCEALLSAGVRLIQYRDKRASSRALFESSQEIAAQAQRVNALFVVNDRADIALAVGAEGVHVGQEDLPVEMARRILGPYKLIGCSTHTLAQVAEADQSPADYLAFGPIFPTESKEKADVVVGLEGLAEARKCTGKPLVAIGGITLQNARAVIDAGADSIAVIRDLLTAPDPGARAREFLRVLDLGE